MTNGQINFVHDLVQMAKAFEELPQVRAELEGISARNSELSETIQRLELRIIDLKTELDAAHEATRKAEVERDHAERMFLETDDRLNAFRRLLRSFQAETDALVKAAEPAPSEQVSVPQAPTFYPETDHGQPVQNFDAPATPAAPANVATEFHGDPVNVDSVSSGPQGSRMDALHEVATTSQDINERIHANNELEQLQAQSEGVSVPSDPTQGSVSSSGNAWPASTPSEASPSVNTTEQPASVTETTASQDAVNMQTSQPEAQPMQPDDVGYHNEPQIDAAGWEAWEAWCHRMNLRYGPSQWPARPDAQAAQ